MMCPLQSVAKGNFWGDKKDTEMHDLQTPSATQTSVENNTPTETATVKNQLQLLIKELSKILKF